MLLSPSTFLKPYFLPTLLLCQLREIKDLSFFTPDGQKEKLGKHRELLVIVEKREICYS